MKKFLSSFIVLMLLVMCCLIAAFPTSAVSINYDDFDIVDDTILEYIGPGGDVVVPSVSKDGTPITRIDASAFKGNRNITSVVICEGIETTGYGAFQECENITELSLPYSYIEAAGADFQACSNVYSLIIPGNLKKIPSNFCYPKNDIVVSPGVEEIAVSAINGQFKEIILPKSVKFVSGCGLPIRSAVSDSIDIYILNPDCKLGEIPLKNTYYKTYGNDGQGPLCYRSSGKTPVTVHALAGSKVESYFNEEMSEEEGSTFKSLTKADIDALEEKCATLGITEATENTTDKFLSEEIEEIIENNKKPTLSANEIDITQWVIIGGGVGIVLIVGLVVAILIINSKKKKKLIADAAVVGAVEEVVAAPTEEAGEEE